MILRYTPQARLDMREIKRYVATELANPKAANRITAKIMKNCALLKEQPRMGASLAEKTGRETALRCLVCGNHIAFYRIEQETISIVRILDGRTNYLRVLFSTEK